MELGFHFARGMDFFVKFVDLLNILFFQEYVFGIKWKVKGIVKFVKLFYSM